ncbi:MAG: carboxypeptidase M32 [Chloroflexi bacterium]|nr:carboxypeptidase M32 [Chloroflexota bacterium]
MDKDLARLKEILAEVDDLSRASALLEWDQQAYAPRGSAEARGQQMGSLNKIGHERFTSPETGKLLETLKKIAKDWDPDSDDARLIQVTAKRHERAVKVPSAMVVEKAEITSLAAQAWQEARAKSNFPHFQPHLEKVLEWTQRYAELFAPQDHPYDALLDEYEPGMKTAEVQAIFDNVRPKQVELIKAIAAKPAIEESMLHQHFPEKAQWDFGVEVVTAFGFDWERGRQDKVTHPFMTNLGYGDQRITTRVYEDFYNAHIFGTMHEAGHALYEQGIPKKLARMPLYNGASLSVHESQSRLWENLVGRSKPFWSYFYPKLQKVFPEQLGKVKEEAFYKAINRVAPSFIRVEADEATYNLHILLRLGLEIDLLEGKVAVKELPSVWNERFNAYLGTTPPDDAKGVLQDVHWSYALMGYFPTYALGNLVSAQLWEVIRRELPDLEQQIAKGEFGALLAWLREKLHRHGAKFEPQEIVQKITGSKIDGAAYIRYLQKKFGEIYAL